MGIYLKGYLWPYENHGLSGADAAYAIVSVPIRITKSSKKWQFAFTSRASIAQSPGDMQSKICKGIGIMYATFKQHGTYVLIIQKLMYKI